MAYLSLSDETPIYYTDEGKGKPIVLLQGLMLTAGYFWQKNRAEIAKPNRLITFDHRGHGLSGKPLSGHTIKQGAIDLKEPRPLLAREQTRDWASTDAKGSHDARDVTFTLPPSPSQDRETPEPELKVERGSRQSPYRLCQDADSASYGASPAKRNRGPPSVRRATKAHVG